MHYQILTFSFKKLINTGNIHKVLQEKKYMKYVLFHLDVFDFLLISCTRNYIHCGEKPVTFWLIFKYFRTFKIIIEYIKKILQIFPYLTQNKCLFTFNFSTLTASF